MTHLKIAKRGKYISIILLAIALITMFTGWLGLSARAKKNLGFFSDTGLQSEIRSIISSATRDVELSNGQVKQMSKAADTIYNSLKDLMLSPGELGKTASSIMSVAALVQDSIEGLPTDIDLGSLAQYKRSAISTIDEIMGYNVFVIIYRVIYYVAILLIVLTMVRLLVTDKGVSVIPLVGYGLLFSAIIAITIYTKVASEDSLGINIVALKPWPFIGLLCVVSSLLVLRKPALASSDGAGVTAATGFVCNTPEQKASAVWVCSSCSSECSANYKFCPRCGTSKPMPKTCPQCGTTILDNAAFCQNCGSRCDSRVNE